MTNMDVCIPCGCSVAMLSVPGMVAVAAHERLSAAMRQRLRGCGTRAARWEQGGTSHQPHSDTALLAAQPNVKGSTNTL